VIFLSYSTDWKHRIWA